MEAGCRRGRGRVLRPRGRAPDTPRNYARQREEDTTIALLRQQQEIMAQMVDFFMEQAIQLRTLTQPIPECVMVEGLMRLFPENISLLFKSEKPRGERSIQEALDFLERQSVLHPPKGPRTELASPKPNVGGTTASGPTPPAPPQGWLGLPPSETREGRSTHSLCHLQVTSVRCPP
jgi:hypothetical protein